MLFVSLLQFLLLKKILHLKFVKYFVGTVFYTTIETCFRKLTLFYINKKKNTISIRLLVLRIFVVQNDFTTEMHTDVYVFLNDWYI